MGYCPVRYDSGVVNYDRRGFIRLATVVNLDRPNVAACPTKGHPVQNLVPEM